MSSAAPLSLSLIMMLISWSRLVPGSWFRSAARRRKSAAIPAQDQKPGEEIVTGPAWISGRATGVETATVGVGLVGAAAPEAFAAGALLGAFAVARPLPRTSGAENAASGEPGM